MMVIQVSSAISCNERTIANGSGQPACRSLVPRVCGMILILSLCLLLTSAVVSAAEYRLSAASADQFSGGINYTGTDGLILVIEDNVTIKGTGSTGIVSASPITIRSPKGRTLTLFVDNDEEMLYGIKSPAVSLESGHLDITVNGRNASGISNAFGISAESGDVTISGGLVSTLVETTCHKNKGIFASRYIVVSGGLVNVTQRGGSNTFGLDGGDEKNSNSGVRISGGRVLVNSAGALNRNIGIDSRSGTVEISGNTAVIVRIGESGARQNYAFNPNITTIDGAAW